jgi:hypothetical protein
MTRLRLLKGQIGNRHTPFRNWLFLFELASTSTTSSFYIYIFLIMMAFTGHCSKLS